MPDLRQRELSDPEGAEAALLLATHHSAIDVVVAFAPTHEVWAHVRAEPRTHPADAVSATIRVEHIQSEVILVAGGDDRVWPSLPAARAIASRRAEHGLDTPLVSHDQPVTGPCYRGSRGCRGVRTWLAVGRSTPMPSWACERGSLKAVLGLDESEVAR